MVGDAREARAWMKPLAESSALWNRSHLDLQSRETLAQILDRGDLQAWRALYELALVDLELRQRLLSVVRTVPLPLPRLWLAALAGLGEAVAVDEPVPPYDRD
jgi:hypothetical protein